MATCGRFGFVVSLGIKASSHVEAASSANKAVRFDATGMGYDRSASGLESSALWTICGWVKIMVDRNDYSQFFGFDSSTDYNFLWAPSDGTSLKKESGSSGFIMVSGAVVGDWYFLCQVHVSDTDGALYWAHAGDSSLSVQTPQASFGGAILSGSSLRIARDRFGTWLNGSIAAVKIWSTSLTSTEVTAEWSKYSPVKTSNLWANYKFDNGPQTTDDSGNGRTLTVTGTPVTDTSGPPIT
jgi:Concanavalin A-like lectin/glucanases superfamily